MTIRTRWVAGGMIASTLALLVYLIGWHDGPERPKSRSPSFTADFGYDAFINARDCEDNAVRFDFPASLCTEKADHRGVWPDQRTAYLAGCLNRACVDEVLTWFPVETRPPS